MKYIVTAFVFMASLAPAWACPKHETTAQSCMTGYVWDSEQGQCVAQITG